MTTPTVPGYPGGMIRVNQPFVNPETGQLSQPALRFLDMIFKRLGGAGDFVFDNQTIVLDNEAAIGDIAAEQQQLTADLQEIAGLFVGRDIEEIKDRLDVVSALLENSVTSTLANDIEEIKSKLKELDEATSEFGAQFSELDSIAVKDKVLNKNIRRGDLGVSAIGVVSQTDWYTAGGTPTKATSDYDIITFETDDFVVVTNSRVRVEYSYTQRGLLNMFEWFVWTERVRVELPNGTLIEELVSNNQSFGCSDNTEVPGGYDATIDFGPTFSFTRYFDVPELTGLWPADGVVKATCDLIPLSAFTGGTECISGATFTASLIKSDYRVKNMSISAEQVESGAVNIIGTA